jgi:hypothetical protein
MKKGITLAGLLMLLIVCAFSQVSNEKPKLVAENMYIMPKQGMEDKFEAAVKAHDQKFHPDGPYKAGLRKVEYGDKAGWYVWVFGPTTYSSLDSRPTKENGHAEDWSKTVDPLVETYGETTLFEFNAELSYGVDILTKSKYYELWTVDLKRGQYYRFKALAEKLKKTYESMAKSAFLVYDNTLHTSKNADVAMLWSFDTYDEWSKDPGLKAAFEKIYGEGSWKNLMDEWLDITVDYNAEIRSFVK